MSEYLSHIFFINLDSRTDRREEIEQELKKMEWKGERFSAIATPGEGIVGCGYSHLAVLKIAKERGYSNVLILEDDFVFSQSKEETENCLRQFFQSPFADNYHVCMLSYIMIQSETTLIKGIDKVLDAQTASGYIVNASYYDELIRLYEWAIPLLKQTGQHWNYANDMVWKPLQKKGNWYFFKPRLGYQREGYSDNKMCFIKMDG